MARPGDAARACEVEFEVKATLVRGLVDVLREKGFLDGVLEHVEPSTHALMLDPPPSTVWLAGRVAFEIQDVVHDLHGPTVLQELQLDALRRGVWPFTRTAAEGVLRLFGASPAALFARMQMLAGTTTKGVSYGWQALTDRSGTLEVRYDRARNVPMSVFRSALGGFRTIFESCGVEGTISEPEIVNDGTCSAARYVVAW